MNAGDVNVTQLSEAPGRISEFLYLRYNFLPTAIDFKVSNLQIIVFATVSDL